MGLDDAWQTTGCKGRVGELDVYSSFDHNVTKDFNTWFLIGSLIYVAVMTGIGIEGIATITKNPNMVHLGNFITGWAQAFGGLIWLIYGYIIRFRNTGEICSGHGLYNGQSVSFGTGTIENENYNRYCPT